mmetsp:Transcript_30687/g.65202  ORF Transcript_30687/g.65202 Transcript_30687/m.65202 type:complete len:91 (+) Transcript_30687:106-378(+)
MGTERAILASYVHDVQGRDQDDDWNEEEAGVNTSATMSVERARATPTRRPRRGGVAPASPRRASVRRGGGGTRRREGPRRRGDVSATTLG